MGRSAADVSGSGATLRSLVLDGVEVLDGFAAEVVAPGSAGQVLAPWPNRLEDGRYEFQGIKGTAAIDEPERMNAIHGLVRWLQWEPVESTGSSVVLETVIVPQAAYPWRIRLQVTYALGDDALVVRFAALNEDDRPAPFAIGFHPYLLAEGGSVDHATVTVDARTHLLVDLRALPFGSDPVEKSAFAALVTPGGLNLSGVVLDDCFTGIARSSGRAVVRFAPGPHSRPVTLTLGPAFTHLMCFTGDTLSSERRRRSLAIEPMTAPPNALRTGDGCAVVEPGAVLSDEFSIALG
ncbi:MAG TPA: aldose 1-epimerase family protein [Acidimicrobiales bacterium]|nr:aldose 1-epimerase family protein [Acidimicrobiales bacterium]